VLRDLPQLTTDTIDTTDTAGGRHLSGHMEGDYLILDVTATLRHSGRPLRLRIVHGVTDVLGPTPPRHWRFAREALAHEQV